jgi:hypothetical protein
MKKTAILLMLSLLFPLQAKAFSNDELLSLVAMPLAVDAVSRVSGVPTDQLATLVATLNQANVPPTQFVEVIRYVPVALTVQNNQQPVFVQYVQTQVNRGVTGDALVKAIVDQLRTNYNVTPTLTLTEPVTTLVVSDNYIPSFVLTPVTTMSSDPLALVEMPLAVAAVSDITGIPTSELANLVATLNQANVPPVQFVQVMRYVPVALVVDNGQPFVQFVQTQVAQGITGLALVPVVEQQIQTYYPAPAQITVAASPPAQTIIVDQNFIPAVVRTRVIEVQKNPHGGPPGQIKKQLGLQTGAEVVHGVKPGRQFNAPPVAVVPERRHGHAKRESAPAVQPMISSGPPPKHEHGKGQPPVVVVPPAAAPTPVPVAVPPGKAKGREEAAPPGQQKQKGKHGKD